MEVNFLQPVGCESLGKSFFLNQLYFYQTAGVKLLYVKPRFFSLIL